MFDGPSKLGQDLSVAIVDELADQDIIPFYTYWLRAIGGVVSPCLTDWPRNCKRGTYSIVNRSARLKLNPSCIGWPDW